VVFRRESRNDAFQRQISELRRQLGTGPESGDDQLDPGAYDDSEYYADDNSYEEELAAERPAARQPTPRRDASAYAYSDYPMNTTSDSYIPRFDEPAEPTIPDLPFLGATDTSVIAQDTFFRGEVDSNGSVHVQGHVEGAITAREGIYVADGAEVEATLSARTIIVSGKVTGTVQASTRLEVLPEGHVSGSVVSPTLVVHNGAHLDGTVRMTLTEEEQSGAPSSATVRQRQARASSSRS